MELTPSIDSLKVQNICLATVTSSGYWKGTGVMLKSFLHHNPWFRGEIVLITDQKEKIRAKLKKLGIEAEILEPGESLIAKASAISEYYPAFRGKVRRLFLLEIFRLEKYDRVIYFDSDILHLDALNTEILFSGELVASRDPWYYRGYVRDRPTLKKVKKNHDVTGTYNNFFNSGYLSVGSTFLNKKTYELLIEKVDIHTYKGLSDSIIDEPILNEFFSDHVVLDSYVHNCPVHLIAEGFVTDNVAVLHFTGKHKPWKLQAIIKLLLRKRIYAKLIIRWYKKQ